MVKQLSVFIENKPGRLAEVTGYLADADINIHALCIADTTDFGILRLIVDDAEKAKSAIKKRGLTVKTTDVAAIALEHKPGSLSRVLKTLERIGVSIEYMYAFTNRSNKYGAMVVLSLADQETAVAKMKECGIRDLDEAELGELYI